MDDEDCDVIGAGDQPMQASKSVEYDGKAVKIQPVSYTHLDVYKRQKMDRLISTGLELVCTWLS